RHCHIHRLCRKGGLAVAVPLHAVLLVQLQVPQEREHPQHGHAGAGIQQSHPIGKEACIATKLIDHDSHDPPPLLWGEQLDGADHLRKHAAAVNICYENHRGAGELGHRPVGQVPVAQVELRCAPGSLDDKNLVRAGQPFVTGADMADQLTGLLQVPSALVSPPDLPVHDHLRALVGLWLEQDGIHIDMRHQATGFRLQSLRPSNLPAIRRDKGVQGHVLRLEGRHSDSLPGQEPTEACSDDALAHVRARSENRESSCAASGCVRLHAVVLSRSHSTSGSPWVFPIHRASTNSASLSRFRNFKIAASTGSSRESRTVSRSAPRHTVRAWWSSAGTFPPPGKINCFSGARSFWHVSIMCSMRVTSVAVICGMYLNTCPGTVARMAPASSSLFWIQRSSSSRRAADACFPTRSALNARTTPTSAFNSSTMP